MADFFQWEDSKYKFNISQIDKEHMEIVKLMNNLYNKHTAQAPTAEVAEALNKLANYTIEHFKDEEKYFDSIGFPGAESHKLIHKQMLSKISDYAESFKKTGTLSQDFFNFLKMWLASHIMGIDSKYAQHAKVKKVA